MKVSEKQLREAVKKVIATKLHEASDFSAKRRIAMMAQQTALEFESTIVKELGLQHPDQMQEVVQRKYFEIVRSMQKKMQEAIIGATNELSMLPREQKDI